MTENWRTSINEYEKTLLLPAIKERVNGLLLYFKKVESLCQQNKTNITFGSVIIEISGGNVSAQYITAQSTPAQVANDFFSDIEEMCKRDFIIPIEKILSEYIDEPNLKEFGSFMNKVHSLCEIALQSEGDLFLYQFNTFMSVHEKISGKYMDSLPKEYVVITMPFKNILQNIIRLCQGTSGTISNWQKELMQWKTKTLELETAKLNRLNQLISIILGLILSIFIFSLTDPYERWKTEQFNNKLKKENSSLNSMLVKVKEKNQMLEKNISELEKDESLKFKIQKSDGHNKIQTNNEK